MTVVIQLALFDWAEIAVQHEDAAHRARAASTRTYDAHAKAELHASMVTLAAATSAIDGLYAVIQPIVTPPAQLVAAAQAAKAAGRRTPNRRAWVIETLKAGYRLGLLTKQVQDDVAWVYSVRNPNVHPKKLITYVHIHPVLGETTWERATYTVESAERAVDLMLLVLDVMTTESSTTIPALVEWARSYRWVVEKVQAERSALAATRQTTA